MTSISMERGHQRDSFEDFSMVIPVENRQEQYQKALAEFRVCLETQRALKAECARRELAEKDPAKRARITASYEARLAELDRDEDRLLHAVHEAKDSLH